MMQKMCNAKHHLLHTWRECVCAVFAELRCGSFKNKYNEKVAPTSGDFEIEKWLFFLRVLENDVETGRKSCRAFGFFLMCPDGDYEIQ